MGKELQGPIIEATSCLVASSNEESNHLEDSGKAFDSLWGLREHLESLCTDLFFAHKFQGKHELSRQQMLRVPLDDPSQALVYERRFSNLDAVEQLDFSPTDAHRIVRFLQSKLLGAGQVAIREEDPKCFRGLWRKAYVSRAESLIFDIDQIAQETQVSSTVVTTVVDLLTPSHLPTKFDHNLLTNHPFKDAPLLRREDGRFVVASPFHLMSALSQSIDKSLLNKSDTQRLASRGDRAEDITFEILRALSPEVIWRGVHWGESKSGGECDIVILHEGRVVAIEVKSTSPGGNQLPRRISEGIQQAISFHGAIQSGKTLFDREGTQLPQLPANDQPVSIVVTESDFTSHRHQIRFNHLLSNPHHRHRMTAVCIEDLHHISSEPGTSLTWLIKWVVAQRNSLPTFA